MESVSVIMSTLNSSRTIERALRSVEEQDFPKDKLEVIVADGGSTDGTLEILRKYGATIIGENTGSPESAKGVSLKKAKNDLVMSIDSDNVLPEKGWLKNMVVTLGKEPTAVAAYPWKYAYCKQASGLNRYFSLLGANDPVAWFLGRVDRQGYGSNEWRLSGDAKDKSSYWLVEFDEENMPTLGANGFLVKRKIYQKAKVGVEDFFHIDVCADLMKQGYGKYVVVKDVIEHDTGDSLGVFLKKRYRYMSELYLSSFEMRRYRLVDWKRDKWKVLAFGVYSLTLVGPLVWSIGGVMKKRDWAWLIHPVMCWGIMVVYGVGLGKFGWAKMRGGN